MSEQWYATDGRNEWTSDFTGPCATPEEAIENYLDEHDPEDNDRIEVTRGRPCAVPDIGSDLVDRLADATVDENHPDAPPWPDFNKEDEKSLAAAVNAAVAARFDANPKRKPTGWIGYGKSEEMTVAEAREHVAAWKAKKEIVTP